MREDRAMPLRQGEGSVRLLISDDDCLSARRVRASVDGREVEVVGIAANRREASRLAGELEPDVIVMGAAKRSLAKDGLRRSTDVLALMDVILAVAELAAAPAG
jgi:chemotaxis response regulator CheB